MIPVALRPLGSSPCQGAPDVTAVSLSDSLDTCAGLGGWAVDVQVTYTGSFGSGFELELWRKAWQDGDSEPGSFTFYSRKTSVGASPVTFSDEETKDFFGSNDQGSGSVTERRKFLARVVPSYSANGAGPFCDDKDSTQLNRLMYNCPE